jgi:hypothetical protein
MFAHFKNPDRVAKRPLDGGTRWFVFWTLFVAFCQCAGWGLSGIHSLNKIGYTIAFIAFFICAVVWGARCDFLPKLKKKRSLARRLRSRFPLAYFVLATLAILGGALYLPNNFDAHAYRTPRVLSWLAEGRWHWIHSHFGNLNSRGAGFEWVTAPLFLFTKTDRLEFLISAVCFLFLPGRVFATLTRLGVRPRVAYYWMWIYPTGYCFLLQAGSIGNDLFSALWPIGALEFALRAQQQRRAEFLWLSIFSAALMTSAKAFNLLLLPAWGISILPALGLLVRRPFGSAIVVVLAAVASMIPTAILNVHYCGDWTGMAVEPVRLNNGPPLFQISVNLVLILITNFAPPIFPFSGAWDRFVEHIVSPGLHERLNQFFETDAARFRISEMQAEESAGLGLGVCLLLLIILLHQLFHAKTAKKPFSFSQRNVIGAAALAGALYLMAHSGLYAPARYLLPLYFPMIVPILALPSAATLLEQKWWRRLALAFFGVAALLLIVSPARPLFPAASLLKNVNAASPPLLQRAASVYSIYRDRADLLRPICEAIPTDIKTLGLILFNEPETSLWRPFGSRRILHIRREDSPQFTRSRGIQYVVIGPNVMQEQFQMTPEEWVQKNNGEIVARFSIKILARGEPANWLLVRLNP